MHAPTLATPTDVRVRTGGDALARAILAGFAASLTMLLLFLLAYNVARLLIALPASPGYDPLREWLTGLTSNRLIDASLSDVYLASGVYFTGGLLWAIVYALVEPYLPGAPWKRGALFSLLPAIVSLVVVLPLLGGGMLGLALGAGPLPIVGNLLLHLVYGAILGMIYGPFGDLDASTLTRPTPAEDGVRPRSYEPTAALLLVGGLFAGALIGLLASTGPGDQSAATILGASNGGLILWGALLGAVIGLFVGTFLGLGQTVAHMRDP